MGIRVRASAFAHPKSPHVAAVDERHFVSALQLVLPRGAATPAMGRARRRVSPTYRTRFDAGVPAAASTARARSWDPLRTATTFASRA